MNRILFLTAALLNTVLLYSQKPYEPTPKSGNFNASVQQVTDTIFGNFFNGTPALYKAQSPIGGYASGNNGFGDKAKAQVFSVDSVCTVHGALVWLGYKNYTSANGNSKLAINLYNLNATVTGQGLTALKQRPDSVLQSKTIDMALLDTSSTFSSGANVVIFDTPQFFDTLFAVGIDFSGLAVGDTVACYTTTNADADSSESSWEQTSDSTWFTMFKNWNLDVDFAIFPIVDFTQTGIVENSARKDIFTIYPNPAGEFFTIKTNNTKGETQWMTIVSATGQTIYNQQLISATTTLSTLNLSPGIYYILVRNADNQGYAQPIVIK